ncbi:GspE/PulE family protein [Deferribacter thermophilus]|uniref:GspE/PulE family protein n=1 Tax=Deferribacter thermophilus TaxID=53573 RepID=UPI003C1BA439
MSQIKDNIIKFYLKFPDKGDFFPELKDDNSITILYSNELGLKKGLLLADRLGLQYDFKTVDKKEILAKLENISEHFNNVEDFGHDEDNSEIEDILSASYQDAPIINLVNQLIVDAVKADASDIHFENGENAFLVKYRIDGVLRTVRTFKKGIHDQVIARIKVMSMLDVAETRKPQDGRINIKVGNRGVDMRVSIIPSIRGEKAVLRILEKTKGLITLENIGMPEHYLNKYREYINRPNGIILVTGPTGSGKTTTLYASLLEIDREEKNIVTIEDPVEYDIDGITQVQVNPVVNLNFASAIRSFLRQDPDVILVGEIRDEETAKSAVQASLTGHLVFSTLHTNDAPTAVARLIDMNVEPFLISSSLLIVIAQRLLRKVCEHCKIEVDLDDNVKELFKEYGISLERAVIGKGCEYCFGTGYKGRTAIFEFLEINDEIRRLINAKSDSEEIAKVAKKYGYKRLIEEGARLIQNQITTVEEVLAVTKFE